MSEALPQIYLARHGETAWTITGQHTGRTDLPLTERGEQNARSLAQRLAGLTFTKVLVSPLQRARRTCELAGFGDRAVIEPDLLEWDYGQYEGLRTAEIRKQRSDWNLFRHGCPGGESVEAIGARVDQLIARLRPLDGNMLVFGHSHCLRVLAARWLGLPPADARLFALGTASVSILGYEHTLSEPVLRLWNDDRHVQP
ncbi:MAG TPA: histidine phosphatase family protein [Isosphaeraceae bacterium]|jgi:probable phosphoglycerate mutase|nr:histidine phosphatase family protein [Isosphaeraceae bacterium]